MKLHNVFRSIALLMLVTAACLTSPNVKAATVLYSNDFTGQADGTAIGPALGWSAKWESPASGSTQRNLYTYQAGKLVLDTTVALRNYHAFNDTAIDLSTAKNVTISTEFQYTHAAGGNITSDLNKAAFGLAVSTTKNWWDGTTKTATLANRGGAVGQTLPVAPWIGDWVTHGSRGVNTTSGGTSTAIRMEYNLVDNGTNVMATTTLFDVASGTQLTVAPVTYDSGLASGSTIYAGFTTGWNNVVDVSGDPVPVSSFSSFESISVDSFSVTAVPEPSSLALIGVLIGGGVVGQRRRNKKQASAKS